jgi:ATP-binding cassette subfamily B (MDR/TAP) protein 1
VGISPSLFGSKKKPSFTPSEQEKTLEQTEQPKQAIRKRTSTFYRIFLGTFKLLPEKVLLGSTAAAISGISRPIFAFYIMTVGIAYIKPDAKSIVSKYSVILFLIGLLTFFSNIFQHYIYGLVGERAMNNLREALFSGLLTTITLCLSQLQLTKKNMICCCSES